MTHYTTKQTDDKPICCSESKADLWTKDWELVDCPKCKICMAPPFDIRKAFKEVWFDRPPKSDWPELTLPQSMDQREATIAAKLLSCITYHLDKGVSEYVHPAVSDYLAFMQACHLRQQIAKNQGEDNPTAISKAFSEFEEATR